MKKNSVLFATFIAITTSFSVLANHDQSPVTVHYDDGSYIIDVPKTKKCCAIKITVNKNVPAHSPLESIIVQSSFIRPGSDLYEVRTSANLSTVNNKIIRCHSSERSHFRYKLSALTAHNDEDGQPITNAVDARHYFTVTVVPTEVCVSSKNITDALKLKPTLTKNEKWARGIALTVAIVLALAANWKLFKKTGYGYNLEAGLVLGVTKYHAGKFKPRGIKIGILSGLQRH